MQFEQCRLYYKVWFFAAMLLSIATLMVRFRLTNGNASQQAHRLLVNMNVVDVDDDDDVCDPRPSPKRRGA
jgi:hypothetical protein